MVRMKYRSVMSSSAWSELHQAIASNSTVRGVHPVTNTNNVLMLLGVLYVVQPVAIHFRQRHSIRRLLILLGRGCGAHPERKGSTAVIPSPEQSVD